MRENTRSGEADHFADEFKKLSNRNLRDTWRKSKNDTIFKYVTPCTEIDYFIPKILRKIDALDIEGVEVINTTKNEITGRYKDCSFQIQVDGELIEKEEMSKDDTDPPRQASRELIFKLSK